MILMLLWNTNNKMATPAPVQLQRPVTVSDVVYSSMVQGYTGPARGVSHGHQRLLSVQHEMSERRSDDDCDRLVSDSFC